MLVQEMSDVFDVAMVNFVNDPVIIVLQDKKPPRVATQEEHANEDWENPHTDRLHVLLPHLLATTQN